MADKKKTTTNPLGQEGSPHFSYIPAPEAENKAKVRKSPAMALMLCGLMVLALAAGGFIYTKLDLHDAGAGEWSESEPTPPVSVELPEVPVPVVSSTPAPPSSEESSEEVSVTTAEKPPVEESAAETDAVPEESSEPVSEPVDPLSAPIDYNYYAQVPMTDAAEESWFEDAVFVGNSRTQGLILYTGIGKGYYCDVGLNLNTVFTEKKFSGKTAEEALKADEFKKVYLMFGINELGWPSLEGFIEQYEKLIDSIRESHPGVQIYIQSILPVAKAVESQAVYRNNANIVTFNTAIAQMAANKGVFFVNVAEIFLGEDGYLMDGVSIDGVHLIKDGCIRWKEYLLSHTVTADMELPEESSEPIEEEVSSEESAPESEVEESKPSTEDVSAEESASAEESMVSSEMTEQTSE